MTKNLRSLGDGVYSLVPQCQSGAHVCCCDAVTNTLEP